jgi:hypothetical protein
LLHNTSIKRIGFGFPDVAKEVSKMRWKKTMASLIASSFITRGKQKSDSGLLNLEKQRACGPGRHLCLHCRPMDLLTQARAERDHWAKIVALLEAAPSTTPGPSQRLKPQSKTSPSSKAYWTPKRRKEMSDRIKALNAKKKKPQDAKKGLAVTFSRGCPFEQTEKLIVMSNQFHLGGPNGHS